jgi:phosphoglycolate phosphatase
VTYKLAIFDFDGTLADSLPFFASVFNELADRHGFRHVSREEMQSLRRLGASQIMRHVGMPTRKLPVVAKDFISMMRKNRHLISPFPGMRELLWTLQRAGVEIGIVSSNVRDNVESILGAPATNAVKHFACGTSIFGKRRPLRKIVERSGLDRSSTIYIGDQASDLEAAHAERIAFGAVAWGYGAIDHLQGLGADHLLYAPDDIEKLFIPPGGRIDASRRR